MKKLLTLILTVLISQNVFCETNHPEIIAGWLEKVKIFPPNIIMHSKLDSGADSCSIHAADIKLTSSKNTKWAEFMITNRYGDNKTLKLKVLRTTKIKTKKRGLQRRPVVSIGICLDTVFEYVECNLVDRSHFEYPVLLGRNFLASNVLIDSSVSYLTTPNCKEKK